ncbi:TonB-dependent receptor [Alterisphingorhabdus coralli]|uniref:TonB-dependent receptor n=1 Tax=Alterisphingorhabdus coralli TaxID=3071408 RepID=A0AA97F5E4_9SPHN|nr:TonB-dependent receptor [Parasphingorhabdus sp. SCSIO 66989]WOE74669.1 TonB-dependent receptor [Parasphingorhabdus sp. SCSIO 66989]
MALTTGAMAQDVSGEVSENDQDDSEPVIVVTAQKREQGLAEVPISIAAVDEATIIAAGADDAASVANLIPNFNVYEGFDRSEVAINVRGLTSSTSNPGIDPSVGFFVDGVYIARPAALTGKLTDISRFEVLRGPQGTLYGRNTSAGAVNIYTNEPSKDLETSFYASYGSYDLVDLRGRISGQLADGIGASVSGFYGRQDSFLNDEVTGDPIGESEDYGIRAKFVIEAAPNFELKLIGDYSNATTNASRLVEVFNKDQNDVAAVLQAAQTNPQLAGFVRAVRNVELPFSRDTGRGGPEADDLEQYGVSLEANWDIGRITLTSITAYRESEDFASVDPDFSAADLFLTSVRNEDEQFSQELRIANNESFGRFDFLLGLFYFDSSFETDTQTEFGVPLFGGFNAMMPPNPITTPQSANSVASVSTEAFAAFGQLSYEIIDDLTLTYGFRYNNETKDGVINQDPDPGVNAGSGIPFPLQFPTLLGLTDTVENEDWINMASLNYQISPNSNIYATYSEGLKAGGINASILLNANGLTFDKETSTSYEIGYRNVFDNGMRLNVAVFYTNFENLQVQTFDPTNPANIIVVNAGEAEVWGIEGDFFWPITDGLKLNLAAAYNNSQYIDTTFPGSQAAQIPQIPGVDLFLPAVNDVDGEALSRAPEVTISGGLQYDFALTGNLNASLRSDVVYTSSQNLDPILSPEAEIGAFTIVNLRAAISTSDDQWEFAVFARNLFDEDYYSQIIASPGAAGLIVDPEIATFFGVQGAPRVIGLEVRKAF